MGNRVRKVGSSVTVGRSASAQLGFFGVAPVSQPTSANQAALTDSTGGTPSTTLAAITAGASYAQADMTAVKNALASQARLLNELRNQLVALGLIKGS